MSLSLFLSDRDGLIIVLLEELKGYAKQNHTLLREIRSQRMHLSETTDMAQELRLPLKTTEDVEKVETSLLDRTVEKALVCTRQKQKKNIAKVTHPHTLHLKKQLISQL